MSKYLLLCTFSGYEVSDTELISNNWKVGEFDSIEECYEEGLDDIIQVAKDSLEYLYEEDEEVYSKEFKKYINGYNKIYHSGEDFKLCTPVEILSNIYWNDLRQELLNYIVIKIED